MKAYEKTNKKVFYLQVNVMDSPRPVLLTKTPETAGEGRTSSTERAVTVMRKDDTVLLPTIETAPDTGEVTRSLSRRPQIQVRWHGAAAHYRDGPRYRWDDTVLLPTIETAPDTGEMTRCCCPLSRRPQIQVRWHGTAAAHYWDGPRYRWGDMVLLPTIETAPDTVEIKMTRIDLHRIDYLMYVTIRDAKFSRYDPVQVPVSVSRAFVGRKLWIPDRWQAQRRWSLSNKHGPRASCGDEGRLAGLIPGPSDFVSCRPHLSFPAERKHQNLLLTFCPAAVVRCRNYYNLYIVIYNLTQINRT